MSAAISKNITQNAKRKMQNQKGEKMSDEPLNFKVARIHRLSTSGSMRAFVDMNINGQLLIKGVRVVEGPKGLFVSMPQEKGKDNKWYETIKCLSKEVRYQIADSVLTAYKKE